MNRSTPDFDVAASPINMRYAAYLDQIFLPRFQRQPLLWTGFVAGIVLVVVGITLALYLGTEKALFPVPVGVWLLLRCGSALQQARESKQYYDRLNRVAQHGVPVTGYLVQANEALFKPGMDNLPCLILFSFQSEVDGDPDYMSSLAHRIFSLKNTKNTDSDNRYVAELTTNERAVPYRRRKLPLSFTDGSTIYCADLWIKRAYLAQGHLTRPFLPCFAEPGESGGLELIPDFLLGESSPSPSPLLGEQQGRKRH